MSGASGGEGDHPQTERRNRVETGGGQRYTPQRERSEKAAAETDRSADCQLVEQRCDDDARLQLERCRAEQQHEDDGRSVVESRLRLQQARQSSRQRHHPKDRKDCSRIGTGDDRAQQQGQLPVDTEDQMGPHCGHRSADDDPDGRENGRWGEHAADIAEPGGQAALDEDDTQRRRAQVLRELGVVETGSPTRFPRE